MLSNNFAKTYNLNQAGQKALQQILEGHMQSRVFEDDGSDSTSLPF